MTAVQTRAWKSESCALTREVLSVVCLFCRTRALDQMHSFKSFSPSTVTLVSLCFAVLLIYLCVSFFREEACQVYAALFLFGRSLL